MKRATVIFGNGLGMALDPDYFQLRTGMEKVWNGTEHFQESHKKLLNAAIPNLRLDDTPQGEEQLNQIHAAIAASQFLKGFERPKDGVFWLNKDASEFPDAFKRYVHEVAMYFHDYEGNLPLDFKIKLCAALEDSRSHVATLNYDRLLYSMLKAEGLCDGYKYLIDGFNGPFTEKNIDRYYKGTQSYYLHLHGSPLFVGTEKCKASDLDILEPAANSHIVLANIRHKPSIIQSSPILSVYWTKLREALKESQVIVLFGYSGLDDHLNDLISLHSKDKLVVVIEWEGADKDTDRVEFWRKKIVFDDFQYIKESKITDFTDWETILAD